MGNALYYGDNLVMLRRYVPGGSIDLVYLDPPFNSDAIYNVLFKSPAGKNVSAQMRAFTDTWEWGEEAAISYKEVLSSGSAAAGILRALRSFLGESGLMAYLCMMTIRLIEMRRVLKPGGSLYLHCDPTASHYLKIILDGVFGAANFRSEIIWKRTSAHMGAKRYGPVHDVILFYTKGDGFTWKKQYQPYDADYLDTFFDQEDVDGRRWKRSDLTGAGVRNGETGLPWRGIDITAKGRHWAYTPADLDRLDAAGKIHWPAKEAGMPRLKQYPEDLPGVPLQDVWVDIRTMHNLSKERLGYPTQKPLRLLERLINASSNPGDVVLDPFCGCGTAIHAAQSLGRSWIGIDVTHLAIQVIEDRFAAHFPGLRLPPVIGRPYDIEAARDLARRDKYQFQWWATWLVGGRARGGERKGADRGVDGDIYFSMGRGRDGHGVISIKGGAQRSPQMIRDLKGTREREGADVGIFVCLEEPTAEMRREAAAADMLMTPIGPVPRIQIYTVEELLDGAQVQLPPVYSTITAAEVARERRPYKAKRPSPSQREMLFPVSGAYAVAEDAPLLEAAEEATAFDHERRTVVRRHRKKA